MKDEFSCQVRYQICNGISLLSKHKLRTPFHTFKWLQMVKMPTQLFMTIEDSYLLNCIKIPLIGLISIFLVIMN